MEASGMPKRFARFGTRAQLIQCEGAISFGARWRTWSCRRAGSRFRLFHLGMRIWRLVLDCRRGARFCAEESAQAIQVEPISGKFLPHPMIGWKRIVDDLEPILIAIESATEDVAEFSSSTGGQPCLVHRATLFEGPLRWRFLGTELIQLSYSAAERGSPSARTGGFFIAPASLHSSR